MDAAAVRSVRTIESLADEYAKVADARPGWRNNQLGISGRAILDLVRDGVVDRETARHDLTEAARRAGLPDAEIASTIRWAWAEGRDFQAHPLAEDEPDAHADAVRDFVMPSDDPEPVAPLPGERTVEFPTVGVAFAGYLETLAAHIRGLDRRRPGDKPHPRMWDVPSRDFWVVRAIGEKFRERNLGMAAAFMARDKAAFSGYAADVLLNIVAFCDDLGVDLGAGVVSCLDQLAEDADDAAPVADQAVS